MQVWRVCSVMLSRQDRVDSMRCSSDLRHAGNAAGLDPRITAVLPNADNGNFGAKVGSLSCWHPVICLQCQPLTNIKPPHAISTGLSIGL